MDELQKENPTLMINLSGSPYSYNHVEKRRNRMQQNAKKYNLPLFYINQVGGNTDVLFDGGSMFINKNGDIVEECAFYHEDFKIIDDQFLSLAVGLDYGHASPVRGFRQGGGIETMEVEVSVTS